METNKHCEQKSLLMGIRQALVLFYKYDAKLLSLKVNEQCLVGNFYRYFCNTKSIRKLLNQDRELHVDLEYDRYGQDCGQKERQSGEKNWRPDMVVHYRGNPSRNICLFEFKRYDSRNNLKEEDHKKIMEAIAPLGLNYHFGCYIEFGETHETSKVELYTLDSDCHCVKFK